LKQKLILLININVNVKTGKLILEFKCFSIWHNWFFPKMKFSIVRKCLKVIKTKRPKFESMANKLFCNWLDGVKGNNYVTCISTETWKLKWNDCEIRQVAKINFLNVAYFFFSDVCYEIAKLAWALGLDLNYFVLIMFTILPHFFISL